MTLRMLINAVHPEESRIAVAQDDHLLELEVERAEHTQMKGNIYKAAITRIEPSLQAAFMDIGSNRNGFLQINDIHPAYFNNWPPENSNNRRGGYYRPSIQDVLRPGQELIVQVVKDERAAKGATLTTNLSIPGRFLVLMVGNQRGGVSRKISDEGQRYQLKKVLENLRLPPGMGLIVRTAGINRSAPELQNDLDNLLVTWYDIMQKSFDPETPKVIYEESDLAVRTIRDYLSNDIDEVIIDEKKAYDRVSAFVSKCAPAFADRVKFYDKPQPLFSRYHLDSQVDATSKPEVTLPAGGSIVINSTEAVVSIDVNSGRSTKQADVEDTAFNTNKEAAQVIAQQLRLRDLGGLIVIDFIDMNQSRHKQIVERVLRDAVRTDKAKIEFGRISKFGLLEMSRQRLKTALASQSHVLCPHCSGQGRVKTIETASLEVIRKIQSTAFAGGLKEIRIKMAPAAALLLLNSKRKLLTEIENATGTSILVYADGRLKLEEYELELQAGKTDVTMAQDDSPIPITQKAREPEDNEDEEEEENFNRPQENYRDNRQESPRYPNRRQGGGGGRYNDRDRDNRGGGRGNNNRGGGGYRSNNRDRGPRQGGYRQQGNDNYQEKKSEPEVTREDIPQIAKEEQEI